MLIDNPDAFKSWLTAVLEPLCDADPAALAKYVYALVKKDKPLDELREGMLDQLDVFLQHETKPFVELLFRTLDTQEYLAPQNNAPPPTSPSRGEPGEQLTDDAPPLPAGPPDLEHKEPTSNGVSSAAPEEFARSGGSAPTLSPPATAAAAAPRHRVVLSRAPPAKHAAPAPAPALAPAPPGRAPYHEQTLVKVMPLTDLLEEPVDQLPRRRDRRTESLKEINDRRRRRSRSRSWERRGRVVRRHPPAWRNSSPPHLAPPSRYDKRRLASRSPSPTPRGRYRNRSPPGNALALSRSRSRSPVQMAPRERERGRLSPREREHDRASRDREHRDRLSRERERDRERDRSRERSRGSAGTPTQDSNPGEPPAAPGTTSLASIFHKRRCRDFDEKGYCMRGDLCQWDHGTDPVVLEDAALSRVLTMAPAVPEYNPLAPDIWSGGAVPSPFPPGYPPHHHLGHPPRELIPIPRVRNVPPPGMGAAVPPLAPMGGAPLQPRPQFSHPPKKHFDYNRLNGPRAGLGQHSGNCSLEVKKVPRGMNDITHLNNHFGKYGRIVNIQVCYEGDPEAALMTFSSHTEANVAYKSTEAVLNNRFIKVFWHNAESKQENVPPSGTNPSGNKTSGPERPAPHVNPPSHAGSHNKVLINKDNMKATADSKVAAANALEKAQKEEGKLEEGKCAAGGGSAAAAVGAAAGGNKQKQVQDMRRRAHTLLQTQLSQQKLLIDKLENGNVSESQKQALMEAIKSAQEGIEKLRKELLSYPKMVAVQGDGSVTRSLSRLRLGQGGGAVVKKLRSREEAQKEILDMELDLFTKQQEGVDVSELMKKVAELRRQQAALSGPFPAHPVASRRGHPSSRGARFAGNTRYSRVSGVSGGKFVNQSVDHRPRALLVSGFEADEIDAVVRHFAQFGEIVSKEVNAAVPELVLQFRARAHAEQAAARAKHYNDRTLSITWTTSAKPVLATAATTAATAAVPALAHAPPEQPAAPGVSPERDAPPDSRDHKQEPEVVVEMSEETLLQDDEEEEEDAEEDRSWRR